MGDEELFSWFRQEVEEHARLTFEQVEMSGTPADPLIFPEPVIADAVKTNVEVFHQGRRRAWSGVIHRQHEQNPTVAYGPRKRLQNAIYGSVWLYTKFQWNGHFGQWETTNELFAIKIFSRTNIRQMKGRLAEDPMKEISTMQFLGLQNIHILGLIEVLQDEDYIYAVMPYCRGGDLLDVKEGYPEARMPEPEARCCFRQILQVGIAVDAMILFFAYSALR